MILRQVIHRIDKKGKTVIWLYVKEKSAWNGWISKRYLCRKSFQIEATRSNNFLAEKIQFKEQTIEQQKNIKNQSSVNKQPEAAVQLPNSI
jgi:hypothetical protein